jgi:hypothetical protein
MVGPFHPACERPGCGTRSSGRCAHRSHSWRSLLLHHLRTFWDRRHLGNIVLVAAAGFDRMRSRAALTAPQVTLDGLWPDSGRSLHRGTNGQWRDLVGPADPDRYEARVHRLAAPGLADWVHRSGTEPAGG